MDTLCGSGGGWTRLAYLDMSDATQSCPSGFRLYQSGGVRACGRPVSNSGSCVSVQFPSNGISYSQVCGRVVGYQYGTTDAIDILDSSHNNLSSNYVDGVSITRGSPHQHVWTLMSGLRQDAVFVFFLIFLVEVVMLTSCSLLLEITTFVNLEEVNKILQTHCTHLIRSGMVKVVALLKQLAVLLLVSHGFTETMVAPPLLTILS